MRKFRTIMLRCLLTFGIICFFASCVHADRYVSLKSAEVNLRVGPGTEYPISWVYIKQGMPMLLIAEFNNWRKVRFHDQTEGWIHQNMVSSRNTALVKTEFTVLYKGQSTSYPIAKIEKNVIVRVIQAKGDWVKVEVHKLKGWIKIDDLWGVNKE